MLADGLAARAARALEARAIPCLLLRGPVIGELVYGAAHARHYGDADLLVPAGRHAEAAAALVAIGLRAPLAAAAGNEQMAHAETFATGDGGAIDLHLTLRGVGAEPARVWAALDRDREEIRVAGATIGAPGRGARALIVALHAAQHGPQGPAQRRDVAHAVEHLPETVWREAAALAEELDAVPAFAAGVRNAPGGGELLDRLGVSAPLTHDLAVRAQGNVPLIRGIARLGETPDAAAKARLVLREVFPTPAFMRQWSALARRGPAGLAAAYALRPLWLVQHLGPALRAHRAARQAATEDAGDGGALRAVLRKALLRSGLRSRSRLAAAAWRTLALRGQREYWRSLKEQEGTFANRHFEPLFTTWFGIEHSFYEGKRILDVGCGPRGSLEWADMAAERVGLDPLTDTYRELGADEQRMTYVAAPAERIPFPDGHFDVVSSFNSLDHVDRLDRAVAEIKRVLAPGGTFLLLTDVDHRPRLREPHDYSWDVVGLFEPELRVVDERHFENRGGAHRSVIAAAPYDHDDPTRREAVLLARFMKRDP